MTDQQKIQKLKESNIELAAAIEYLLELGRKDTSNPKYDGYYQFARKALKNNFKNIEQC